MQILSSGTFQTHPYKYINSTNQMYLENINSLRNDTKYEKLFNDYKRVMIKGEFTSLSGTFFSSTHKKWIRSYTVPVIISGEVHFFKRPDRNNPKPRSKARISNKLAGYIIKLHVVTSSPFTCIMDTSWCGISRSWAPRPTLRATIRSNRFHDRHRASSSIAHRPKHWPG